MADQYPLGKEGKIIGSPYQGTHARSFNQRGGSDNWESENAYDIGTPDGTPVVAVADGTIGDQIGSLESGGRFAGLRVHLVTSDNEFYYAHLSKLTVQAGQIVRAGQIIGYSGSANGVAHLHFASKTGTPGIALEGQVSVLPSTPAATVPAATPPAPVTPADKPTVAPTDPATPAAPPAAPAALPAAPAAVPAATYSFAPPAPAAPADTTQAAPEPSPLPAVTPPGVNATLTPPGGGPVAPGTVNLTTNGQPQTDTWQMLAALPNLSPDTQALIAINGGAGGS